MSKSDQVERELKLGAWPEFVLPDLAEAIAGVSPGQSTRRELDAVYFDTPDLHLLRRGATLRFRRGEAPGDVWTAKLPSDASATGLARREITIAGRRGAVPSEFADLMRGWALGRRVQPVARVHTLRVSLSLHDDDGNQVAMLDDDSVTVRRGRRVLARFRELEVELVGDASSDLIAAVDERLRAAGAEKVPQIPKLGRALGREATLSWQLTAPETGSKPTLAAAAHSRLVAVSAELVDLHAPLVVDVPGSARRAVVAVARLRAALDALGPLFEPAPPVAIGATLDWLAGELAQLDALDSLLGSVCDARPLMGGPGERALVARVDAARTRARARVLRALRDRRYAQLLQRLAALAAGPATASSAGRRRATSAAGKFVRGHWRPVRDGASADSPTLQPAVDQLAAALELAASVTSPDATAALERVALLQEAAAEHADAVAVAARLRAFARRAESVESWAAGVVTGLQMARGEDAATRFAQIRQTLAQKSAWSWTE